ncbi:ABC-three component system protein [Clavibacter michiganensis]|uniref:ABC-three component system protein n=1 Tax=Clavibacter michiganensis TaxID=28447 RepID=UPI0037577795
MRIEDLPVVPSPDHSGGSTLSAGGPYVFPSQRILLYSDAEWESFVLEWLASIATEYTSLRLMAGPGDKGIDVAAFVAADGFDGVWDSYQCKHYAQGLTPSDVFPEILKLIQNTQSGEFSVPRAYYFVAPRGCGTTLTRYLKSSVTLKSKFLDWLSSPHQAVVNNDSLWAAAQTFDYRIFDDITPEEILDSHRLTRYHFARFGGTLSPRLPDDGPPEAVQDLELRYVEQLVDVYMHEWPSSGISYQTIHVNDKSKKHFTRQRLRFYKAESLERYARDEVPEGTYRRLQEDVLEATIDVSEGEHSSPMKCLNAVLDVAGSVDLSGHALISVMDQQDRKGICHQLANRNELRWASE